MQKTKKIKTIIGTIYLILLFIFLYLFFSKFTFEEITTYKFIQSNTEYLTNIKETNTILLSFGFMIIAILWVFLLGFGSPIALVAGFIFGKWLGTLVSVVSLSTGATLLYYLANFFFKDFIKSKLSKKAEKFVSLFNKNDFLYFTLFRFTGGGLPFAIQNVLPVIFNMKIKKYFFATLLGILPSSFIITSIGAGVGSYINKNDSIVFVNLIKDPEIFIPILIFFVVLVIAMFVNKFLKSNS